jgi:N-acetylneuraminic acid mutarotase
MTISDIGVLKMKRIIIIFMLLKITFAIVSAQGTWTQRADFGGSERNGAVAFSIGEKGYIGMGSGTKDFWEYDPKVNIWTQKADFEGTARSDAVAFSIGEKGYIGMGSNAKDFWEYDPTINTWTQKADFAGTARRGAVGFSIGDKGYFGTGGSLKDFWEYDPSENTWSQKADMTEHGRYDAVGFAIGGKGYVGTGFRYIGNIGSQLGDFWEYDPSSDSWTQKANVGGPARELAVGFSIGNMGYIGTGIGTSFLKDFWAYDPISDTWTKATDFEGTARTNAVGFSIGNKGYIGTGLFSGQSLRDFWEYDSGIKDSITDGLVAYYPFNGNANDESGNGNHGTVQGATLTTDRFGNSNSAFSFNGTSHSIIAPSNNLPIGNSPRSISIWIKSPNMAVGNRMLIGWGKPTHYQMSALALGRGYQPSRQVMYWGWGDDFNINQTLNDNTWYHITFTYNGDKGKLYVNGELDIEYSINPNTPSGTSLYIANFTTVVSNFVGIIDDIRIYNRSLTDFEIQSIYIEGGWSNHEQIIITSPIGGEMWHVGSEQTIIWSSKNINYINIDYSIDAGSNWESIATLIPASQGSYEWKVPDTPTEQAMIRICDAGNSGVCDESGVFSIDHGNNIAYTILDYYNQPIINKYFEIYIVDQVTPTEQEQLGTYATNEYGKLILPRNIIDEGEYFRVKKRVHTEPSVKIANEVMYYIDIDNMIINNDGSIEFYKVTNEYNQEIMVNNTTIKLNLVISIEWDANEEYYDVLKDELKRLSNYLFDVTDGHLYLNKVHIYDNKEKWNECDIRIFADNSITPNARVMGMFSFSISAKINYPRRWIGNNKTTINLTAQNDWLSWYSSDNYRTIGHEIGHYYMGFYDEYRTFWGTEIGFRANAHNYGFMDYQYEGGGVFEKEMSSPYRYPSSDYEITMQWTVRGMDCWSQFKKQFEDEYNGIFCPIVKPTGRELNGEYLPGPEYNVSDLLDVTIDNYKSNTIYPLRIRWLTEDGDEVSDARVRLEKNSKENGRNIYQGKSAYDGNIIVLGGETGDQVIAVKMIFRGILSGYNYFIGRYNIEDHEQPNIVKSEMQDINVQSLLDDIVITMSPISGEFYFVGYSEYEQSNQLSFNLFAEEVLDSKPIIYYSIGDDIVSKELIKSNKYYSSQLDSNISKLGEILLTIEDDDGQPFDIVYGYIVESNPYEMHGPNGNVHVLFDTLNQNIENSIIMSSDFSSPGDDGLELPIRVSEVISVFGYPQTNSLSGDNYITIGYREVEDIDIEDGGVAVYRWDLEGEYWEHIGGEVNTSRNEVTAELTKYGVYAAFVTDVTSTPQKMNYKPQGFNLYQNYPNPFNPSTKIRFDVPHRERVKVLIYNTLGQQVMRLIESEVESGVHEITFDASHLPSGVYIYRLQAGEFVESKKLILLK